MSKIKSILITTESASFDPLVDWCQKRSIQLVRQSQITTKPVLNCIIPKSDWLFFSSPQSAIRYLDNYPIRAQSIAVYGKGTKKILTNAGIQVNYIGKENAQPIEIGREFKKILKLGETVLFPISQRSKKTIIHQLEPEQCIEIILYTTTFVPHKQINQPDLILFTSPSNYESYCLNNVISKETQLVAMGSTTALKLKQHSNTKQLLAPTVTALIKLLEKLVD